MVDNLEEEHLRREVFTTAVEGSSQSNNQNKAANAGILGSKDASFEQGTHNLSNINQTPRGYQSLTSPLGPTPSTMAKQRSAKMKEKEERAAI